MAELNATQMCEISDAANEDGDYGTDTCPEEPDDGQLVMTLPPVLPQMKLPNKYTKKVKKKRRKSKHKKGKKAPADTNKAGAAAAKAPSVTVGMEIKSNAPPLVVESVTGTNASEPTTDQKSSAGDADRKRRNAPKLVHSGPAPTLGPGWTVKTFERRGGNTAGSCDSYWFSPNRNKKFRSLREVKKFEEILARFKGGEGTTAVGGESGGGDAEDLAWKEFKSSSKKRKVGDKNATAISPIPIKMPSDDVLKSVTSVNILSAVPPMAVNNEAASVQAQVQAQVQAVAAAAATARVSTAAAATTCNVTQPMATVTAGAYANSAAGRAAAAAYAVGGGPARSESKSKYSAEKIRARKLSDGSIVPATQPKKTADGLYMRPAGRKRKGMDWDEVRGRWVPAVDDKQQLSVEIRDAAPSGRSDALSGQSPPAESMGG